jgi:hypothetical protein
MDNRIDNFLNKATDGLRDDSELQLDARAELLSHAECKLQELKEDGASDDTATAETIKALGDPLELASDLYSANLRRMKLRACAMGVLRFASFPLALFAIVWSINFEGLEWFFGVFNDPSGKVEATPYLLARDNLTDKQKFLITGDLSRETYPEQQKAIWESDPTNKVYFANYFSAVVDHGQRNDACPPLELIQQAQQIDPENAMYVYFESKYYLYDSIKIQNSAEDDRSGNDRSFTYEVLDRDRLDKGMRILERALQMPLIEDSSERMLSLQMSNLPPPESAYDIALRMLYSNQRHFSLSFDIFWGLIPSMISYGEILLHEGDRERALLFLQGYDRFAQQILAMKTTDEMHISIVEKTLFKSSEALDIIEQHYPQIDTAPMRKQIAGVKAINEEWRENRFRYMWPDDVDRYRPWGFNYLAYETEGEDIFESERQLEYAVAARFLVKTISIILLLVALSLMVLVIRWRLDKTSRVKPMLIIPRWSSFLQVLACGVILPSLLFVLVARFMPESGHDYSIWCANHKLKIEFAVWAGLLLTPPFVLTERMVRRRCAELDILTPIFLSRWLNPIFKAGGVLLIVTWFIPIQENSRLLNDIVYKSILVMSTLLLLIALLRFFQVLFGKRKFGLFYGTYVRSLIPILAIVILSINFVIEPYLTARERQLIRQNSRLQEMINSGRSTDDLALPLREKREKIRRILKSPDEEIREQKERRKMCQ